MPNLSVNPSWHEAALRRCELAGNTRADRADGEVVYYHRTRDPYAENMARINSTGGWIASALDLVRFATHVDGLAHTPSILRPATIRTMTTPSTVHPRYAHGWGVIEGNWWHDEVNPSRNHLDHRRQAKRVLLGRFGQFEPAGQLSRNRSNGEDHGSVGQGLVGPGPSRSIPGPKRAAGRGYERI